MDAGAHSGPAGADGPARLRDRGSLLPGAAVARGAAVAHDPRSLLRARVDGVRDGVLVGDQSARAGRACRRDEHDERDEQSPGRPEGLDAGADPGRGRERVPQGLAPPAKPVGAAGRPARRVPPVEQLSQERAGNAARRRVVPLRRAPRPQFVLVAGGIQRRLPVGSRAPARHGRERRGPAPGRFGGAPAPEDRGDPGGPGDLARRGGRARGRARGAPGEAAPPPWSAPTIPAGSTSSSW